MIFIYLLTAQKRTKTHKYKIFLVFLIKNLLSLLLINENAIERLLAESGMSEMQKLNLLLSGLKVL